jgi:hypothetical protein
MSFALQADRLSFFDHEKTDAVNMTPDVVLVAPEGCGGHAIRAAATEDPSGCSPTGSRHP